MTVSISRARLVTRVAMSPGSAFNGVAAKLSAIPDTDMRALRMLRACFNAASTFLPAGMRVKIDTQFTRVGVDHCAGATSTLLNKAGVTRP